MVKKNQMPDYEGALKLKDIRRVTNEKKDKKAKGETVTGNISGKLEGYAKGGKSPPPNETV